MFSNIISGLYNLLGFDSPAEFYDGRIDSKLTFLAEKEESIQLCRDIFNGYDTTINTKYVPKWESEDEKAYKLRVRQTLFVNYYERVVTGFTSLIFQKDPLIEGLEDFHMNNVDMRNSTFSQFMNNVFNSSLVGGMEFISVESDPDVNRAFFKRYKYEQLYSFDTDNSGRVTELVFKDFAIEKVKNRKRIFHPQWIVFKIGGGEIYRAGDNGQLKRFASWSNNLKEIPVLPIITGKVQDTFNCVPRLYDLARLNLFLIDSESLTGNIMVKKSMPIFCIFGKTDSKDTKNTLKLGTRTGLNFQDKKVHGVEYVEPIGDVIEYHNQRLERVDKLIDTLCYSILTSSDSKTVVEAQEQQNKSSSFIRSNISQLNNVSNLLMQFKAQLENRSLPANAKIQFKNGFDDVIMNRYVLDKLIPFLQEGVVDGDELRAVLKEENIIKDENKKINKKFVAKTKKNDKKN